MKKLIALLMVLMILVALVACGNESANTETTAKPTETEDATEDQKTTEPPQEKMVTVYVPESVRVEIGGVVSGPFIFNYEEGWETKDSFTVQYSHEAQSVVADYTVTYGDKYTETIIDVDGAQTKQVMYYDENGYLIRAVIEPATGEGQKTENIYVHDEKGREISQEVKSEAVTSKTSYIIEETTEGSKGVAVLGNSVTEMTYDQEGRLLSTVTFVDGNEIQRTEQTYDENGCVVTIATYYMGQLTAKNTTTYKAVLLSEKKALQMPQFERGE